MRILIDDITKLRDVEAIVCASNGVGVLGDGVAGAIGQAGGLTFRNDVRHICENKRGGYNSGECYISKAGDLEKQGIRHVYHAVTMKYPGSPTSNAVIKEAMQTTLELAIQNGIKSIAFPGLGTGVGELSKERVAVDMVDVAMSYDDSIAITIADIDKAFIDCVRNNVQTEAL